jgi:signal peptidase I
MEGGRTLSRLESPTPDQDPTKTPRDHSTKSALREIVETVVFTLVIYVFVRTFLLENYRVIGSSMEPTLLEGQFLVINKLEYRFHGPDRGDIVVFRDPNNPGRNLIKRAIGLPGEVVEIRSGTVVVDGRALEESYLPRLGTYSRPPSELGPQAYFVLGDNRNNSSDSHNWGPVPASRLVGQAWFCYWPVQHWGLLARVQYVSDP